MSEQQQDVARMRRRLVQMLSGGQVAEPATTEATPATRAPKRRGRPRKRRDTPKITEPATETPERDLSSEAAEPHAGDDEGQAGAD